MSSEFYNRALDILNNLTTEELESGLREFGIECQRKVSVFDAEEVDVLGEFGISWPATRPRRLLEIDELASMACAANDNSYALAA